MAPISISSILSAHEFRILKMKFVGGLTQREIAAVTNDKQSGVCSKIQAALEKIRAAKDFIVDLETEYESAAV